MIEYHQNRSLGIENNQLIYLIGENLVWLLEKMCWHLKNIVFNLIFLNNKEHLP